MGGGGAGGGGGNLWLGNWRLLSRRSIIKSLNNLFGFVSVKIVEKKRKSRVSEKFNDFHSIFDDLLILLHYNYL